MKKRQFHQQSPGRPLITLDEFIYKIFRKQGKSEDEIMEFLKTNPYDFTMIEDCGFSVSRPE